MAKRPSLFATAQPQNNDVSAAVFSVEASTVAATSGTTRRPPSREGKRILSIYLDPLAWKQLRQLALDHETTTQALGEEAVNLLFTKNGINRSA
jgi:hypothetical protein